MEFDILMDDNRGKWRVERKGEAEKVFKLIYPYLTKERQNQIKRAFEKCDLYFYL
jgi:hypothetical protein